MKINPYLAFDGRCREAFEFYEQPFQPTFWAKGFGMLIDQFGTPWIVNAGQIVEVPG